MNSERNISRRRLLALTLGAGLWPLARPAFTWAMPAWRGRQSNLSVRLAALLRHRESARAVGLEYLRQYPREADGRVLCALLSSVVVAGCAHLSSVSDDTLRETLALRVHQDFETEDVVNLRGWILSRTEARLCALTVLA